jgi:acyl dehydratase
MPKYFEDFEVGDRFEFGEREVTADEIVEFARKYDPQPFHVDREAAEDSHFGRLVASGMHTLAVTMRIAVDGFYGDVENVAGKGMDDVQFRRPLLPGAVVRVTSTVLEKANAGRPEHGTLRSEWVVTDLNTDEVVLSLEMSEILQRRNPVES